MPSKTKPRRRRLRPNRGSKVWESIKSDPSMDIAREIMRPIRKLKGKWKCERDPVLTVVDGNRVRHIMELGDYQKWVRATARYPGGLTYPILGLAGESGEIANDLLKLIRARHNVKVLLKHLSPKARKQVLKELGDALWYLTAAVQEMGSTLEELSAMNYQKLMAKIRKGTAYRKLS